MNTARLILAAACTASLFLTGCEVVPVAGGPGNYAYGDNHPAYHQPYDAPARVTQNRDGYLVQIGNRFASYDQDGRLTSGGACSPSEIYHARAALNDFRAGQQNDYYHPNYYPSSHPSYTSSGNQGAPEVRPRGDGMFEVSLPAGGVVLYDRYGNVVQKGSTVTGGDLYRANRAVQSYLREQNSSRGYDGV